MYIILPIVWGFSILCFNSSQCLFLLHPIAPSFSDVGSLPTPRLPCYHANMGKWITSAKIRQNDIHLYGGHVWPYAVYLTFYGCDPLQRVYSASFLFIYFLRKE